MSVRESHLAASSSRILNEGYPLGLICGALGVLILAATASLFIAGPQIEVDEGSYLLTAAKLVGKLGTSGVNGYYSGYSLLLMPAFLAGADPARIYHAALLINALLVATTPFALFRLTRMLFPSIASKWHAAAAIGATCYASLLLLTQHAMSESALVPLFAWLLATGAETALAARKSSALACGLSAGALFLVHPRGGMMAAAVLVALTVFCAPRASLRTALAMMWIAALCVCALHAPLENLAGKPAALGSSYSAGYMLRRLLHPSAWPWIAFNGFGALTEAVASSLGVVAIALGGLAADLAAVPRRDRKAEAPRIGVIMAIALGFAVGLLMSATFFIPPQRADYLAYGRYALPATVPLLAIGLLRFSLGAAARRRDASIAMATGLTCIVLMGIGFSRLPAEITRAWNYVNAPMLYIAQHAAYSLQALQNSWLEIGICFVVFGGALYLFALASRASGIGAYVALNLGVAAFGWLAVTWPSARVVNADRHVVAAANAFGSVTGVPLCVQLSDELQHDFWIAIDMRWHALNAQTDTIRDDARPCATASIDVLKGGTSASADRVIAIERLRPEMQDYIGLFVEPGPALTAWKAKMAPIPPETLAPLPESERRADVVAPAAADLAVRVGKKLSLDVQVTNTAVSTAWPADDQAPYPIRLGARVFPADGTQAVGEYRAAFAAPIPPGGRATVHIDVGPFARPGMFTVSIGVVQERVAWFADTQDIRVQVSD
ncbi:MAG TPA: hypothetical protein VHE32_13765 [Rhodanobacteraceae bacterium]|nr:hypothetical protein [Rhodanobacteraceae bacterium]